jgi:dephospho-CoA kinase
VRFVGLSGGIGSGKSTVGRQLALKGAEVIDVDIVLREIQQPGRPIFDQIVARWGSGVLDDEGRLDREELGRIVFSDQAQLGELTGMTVAGVVSELDRRVAEHMGPDDVVIVEAALYPARMYGMGGLVLVDTPVELAVARLVSRRGMTEADARARAASQLRPEDRLAGADFVIDNAGAEDDLEPQIDRAWQWIHELPHSTPTIRSA